jgi:hypothetical protein
LGEFLKNRERFICSRYLFLFKKYFLRKWEISNVPVLQNVSFISGICFIPSASGLCRGWGKLPSMPTERGAITGVIANTIRAEYTGAAESQFRY